MNIQSITDAIIQILNEEIELSVKVLNEDDSFQNLGVDSIALMTLLVYLEEKFGIEIDIDDELSEEYSKIKVRHLINAINQGLEIKKDEI